MNQKLQKVVREIERTTKKISELQTLLPELERQKKELEDLEIIKVFRTADVSPDEIAEFIAAFKAQGGATVKPAATPSAPGYSGAASFENIMEESEDE